jgi:membrane-associated phospholipid phosphatase
VIPRSSPTALPAASSPGPWSRIRGPLTGAACVLALFVVVLLGHSLVSGRPPAIDVAVLDGLTASVPPAVGQVLRGVYQLSGVHFTVVLVLAALIFLILKRSWRELSVLVVATSGILLIVDRWLKPFFQRARPPASLLDVEGHSFPSGHAAGSVVFYFLMCSILSARYPRLTRPLYGGSVLWVSLVWLSSLYSRAHWFTDIVAGASVGFLWLTLCLAWLHRRPAD